MRLVAKLLWVFVVVLAVVGCNNVYTPPETAPLNLTIQGLGGSSFDRLGAVEGVQVCEGGTDENCAMSDASGEVTLELPVGHELFYTLEKKGYDSALVADVIPENGESTFWFMWTDELRATWYEFYESPYPRPGTGEIYIQIQPGFGGAIFDLVGATGKRWYDAASPLHATSTTKWGTGGFVELTPGAHQVMFGGTASQCALTTGWPGDGENSVRTRVQEDYVSYVILQCAPPPFDGSALVQVIGRESQGAGPQPPLERAEVCETDTTNCVTTDAGGMAWLKLPVNEEVSIRVTKDGYEPKLKVDETDDDFNTSPQFTLWNDELVGDLYESVMSPYPQVGTGSVRVGTGGLAGVTCELIDETGKAFYVDEEGQWSLDLEATTSAGRCGFLEVPPGEFQIELGGTGSGCVPKQAWPGDAENRIRFLVRDGHLTVLTVDCPTP